MKRVVVSLLLLLFAGIAAAAPPRPMAAQQRSVTKFEPINFSAAAEQEKRNPPPEADEVIEIDEPQPPPPGRRGVPIAPGTQPPGDTNATPPSGNGPSPPPKKTFQAEFLNATTIPPDTMGAVGTSHIVTVSNDRMRILTRDGVELSRMTITAFWAGVTIKGQPISAFDPKVLYDRFNNRFILISSGNGTSVNSGAMFAVSATADPTGVWYRWSVAADPASTGIPSGSGNWIDYPTIGHNKNWIVVDENVFRYTCNTTTCSSSGYWGQQIYILDKQAAYSNTLSTINLFAGDFNATCTPSATPQTELACGFTMAPAITEDNTTDAVYLVEDWDSTAGQLRVSKITGTPSTPVLTVGTQFPQSTESWRFDAARIGTAANCGGTCSGGYAPQRQQSANLPSGSRIQTNDSRVQNAVFRNGSLWAAHTVMLSASAQAAGTTIGGAGNPVDNHSGIQWWQIDPTNETGGSVAPLQRGRLHDPGANNCHNGSGGTSAVAPCNGTTTAQFGEFFAFPNISVNQNNDVFIGFSRFSPLTYPNSGYAIRRSSDPANTLRDPVVFRPGQSNYNIGAGSGTSRQDRWGDYSAAQTDPLDDTTFWTVQEYAGANRNDFLAPSYAGPWETWWAQVDPTASPPTQGTLIINEFRLRGPQGVRDEFVELYNPSATPIVVNTTDGSDGWALVYSANGTAITQVFAVIPNGTVVPAFGHFLVADNPDNTAGGTSALTYSLNGASCSPVRGANSDTGWALDLADNGGIALFNTATTANFAAGTRLDSAGFSTIAAGLFKEGNGIPAVTAATPTGQITFYRNVSTGVPADTGANENDFRFLDSVVGETLGSTPTLGAAGPENLDCARSDTTSTTLPVSLVDSGLPGANAPNRQRDATAVTNGALGTLSIRRTFTNNTGAALTRLRFRVANMSTNPAAGSNADLRALTSGNAVVSLSGGGTANVSGTTLETPPAQAAGGGLNATLNVPAVSLATPLAEGSSINLQFTLGVQTAGNFNFCIFAETSGASSLPVTCFGGHTENQLPSITPAAVSRTQGDANVTTTIATVSDSQDSPGSLAVVATSVPSGITLANIVNNSGTVSADISVDCAATTGANNVTLQVTDSEGAVQTATLVITVAALGAPPVPTISADTNGTGTQDQSCPEQPLTLHANGSTGATSYQWYKDIDLLNGETTSTYAATGTATYYVTATNVCGTSAKSAGYVVQNPTPHSPFISFRGQNSSVTTLAICQGTTQIIDSDSATGIHWWKDGVDQGPSSQSYSTTVAGVYTAQLNALGCHSQFGRNVTLTVTPLPSTPTITPGGPTTFIQGGSVTLTSSSASGNQWKRNGTPIGGATNQTYVATTSGTYTVVVTQNQCDSAASSGTVVTVIPSSDLAITNTDGVTNVHPGGSATYTITASNASGPSAATGATVTDTFPASLTCTWTCVGAGGGTCTASGSGNINDTVNLPIGGSTTYTASCTVSAGASGSLSNTATVAVAASADDPVAGNNSATDTDTVQPEADLALTLTNNRTVLMSGRSTNYVIRVTNASGPNAVTGTVTDTLPPGVTNASWVCLSFGGAACGSGSGSGFTLSDTATLPVGGEVVYVYTATVLTGSVNDLLANTASVAVTGGTDPTAANNSATDTDLVKIFADGFEGTPTQQPLRVGDGGDRVSATLRVDAALLGGLSYVPATIGTGRAADGRELFTLEIAKFGNDVMLRALAKDGSGNLRAGTWQRANLSQNQLTLTWQAAAADLTDGYLGIGSGQVRLLNGSGDHGRLTQLWVAVENGKPWVVLAGN